MRKGAQILLVALVQAMLAAAEVLDNVQRCTNQGGFDYTISKQYPPYVGSTWPASFFQSKLLKTDVQGKTADYQGKSTEEEKAHCPDGNYVDVESFEHRLQEYNNLTRSVYHYGGNFWLEVNQNYLSFNKMQRRAGVSFVEASESQNTFMIKSYDNQANDLRHYRTNMNSCAKIGFHKIKTFEMCLYIAQLRSFDPAYDGDNIYAPQPFNLCRGFKNLKACRDGDHFCPIIKKKEDVPSGCWVSLISGEKLGTVYFNPQNFDNNNCAVSGYPNGEHKSCICVKCSPCPKGKYMPYANRVSRNPDKQQKCEDCDYETYTDLPGQKKCKNCPLGKFQELKGQQECVHCVRGKYREGAVCFHCPIGKYGIAGQKCDNCPAGKYTAATGQMECKICPNGKYSFKGREQCLTQNCLQGYFPAINTEPNVCRKCRKYFPLTESGSLSSVSMEGSNNEHIISECEGFTHCPFGIYVPERSVFGQASSTCCTCDSRDSNIDFVPAPADRTSDLRDHYIQKINNVRSSRSKCRCEFCEAGKEPFPLLQQIADQSQQTADPGCPENKKFLVVGDKSFKHFFCSPTPKYNEGTACSCSCDFGTNEQGETFKCGGGAERQTLLYTQCLAVAGEMGIGYEHLSRKCLYEYPMNQYYNTNPSYLGNSARHAAQYIVQQTNCLKDLIPNPNPPTNDLHLNMRRCGFLDNVHRVCVYNINNHPNTCPTAEKTKKTVRNALHNLKLNEAKRPRCANCTLGKYRDGTSTSSGRCQTCPTGKYSSENSQTCLSCAEGMQSNRRKILFNSTRVYNHRISLKELAKRVGIQNWRWNNSFPNTANCSDLYRSVFSNGSKASLSIPEKVILDTDSEGACPRHWHRGPVPSVSSLCCTEKWQVKEDSSDIDPGCSAEHPLKQQYEDEMFCYKRSSSQNLCNRVCTEPGETNGYNDNFDFCSNELNYKPCTQYTCFNAMESTVQQTSISTIGYFISYLYHKCKQSEISKCNYVAEFDGKDLFIPERSVCTYCPVGMYSAADEDECKIAECPPGQQFNPNFDAFSENSFANRCIDCEAGKYSKFTDRNECTECNFVKTSITSATLSTSPFPPGCNSEFPRLVNYGGDRGQFCSKSRIGERSGTCTQPAGSIGEGACVSHGSGSPGTLDYQKPGYVYPSCTNESYPYVPCPTSEDSAKCIDNDTSTYCSTDEEETRYDVVATFVGNLLSNNSENVYRARGYKLKEDRDEIHMIFAMLDKNTPPNYDMFKFVGFRFTKLTMEAKGYINQSWRYIAVTGCYPEDPPKEKTCYTGAWMPTSWGPNALDYGNADFILDLYEKAKTDKLTTSNYHVSGILRADKEDWWYLKEFYNGQNSLNLTEVKPSYRHVVIELAEISNVFKLRIHFDQPIMVYYTVEYQKTDDTWETCGATRTKVGVQNVYDVQCIERAKKIRIQRKCPEDKNPDEACTKRKRLRLAEVEVFKALESTWDLKGQTKCTGPCKPGYYKTSQDTTQDCKACPQGKWSNPRTISQAENECKKINVCRPGEYEPIFPPATSDNTIKCPAGKFNNMTTCKVCRSCPKSKYQDKLGKKECKLCPEGQYQDFIGRSSCKEFVCPPGRYKPENRNNICEECPAGQHTYEKPNTQSECCQQQNDTDACPKTSQTFEFANYDTVRARLYPCYGNSHIWGPGNGNNDIQTLVLCPCQNFGDILQDNKFVEELALSFGLPYGAIGSLFTQFYMFQSNAYDPGISERTSHSLRFRFSPDDVFEMKPFRLELERLQDRSTIHGINVTQYDNVKNVLLAKKDSVCWAMLLQFLRLSVPKVQRFAARISETGPLNAFSENLCLTNTCPKTITKKTISEINSISNTKTIAFLKMDIMSHRCSLSYDKCYEYCEKNINVKFDSCGFLQDSTQIHLHQKFCSTDLKSLCIVYKEERKLVVASTIPITLHKFWYRNLFNCMQHTIESRKVIRQRCFESDKCFMYGTNSQEVCLIPVATDVSRTTKQRQVQFTHLYEKATYDESRQRIRLEFLNRTVLQKIQKQRQNEVATAGKCKNFCYNKESCMAWQWDRPTSFCTLLSIYDEPNSIIADRAAVSKNEVCARKLLHSNMETSCKNLNERLNHKEVNRFWLDVICDNDTTKIYAPIGAKQCDASLQFRNEGYCGIQVAQLSQDTVSNAFYANEDDNFPLLVGEDYEFRIGNFRDGFSGFINVVNETAQRCTYETFYKFKAEKIPSLVTSASFCQRRSRRQTETDLNCGSITSRQARIEHSRAPSCEVCPITHKCSQISNTCERITSIK